MSFGELQLKKFGWREGKGLGVKENGISSPLKPKLKDNLSGLGHNPVEEFSFHWWDHVYNKATKNMSISKNEEGSIQIVKADKLKVSTKKRHIENNKSNCYGYFIKGCVLDDGNIVEEKTAEKTALSNKEEESLELIKKLSDEELLRACDGRTAHKGARHGIKMSAKLARLEEQEKAFFQAKSRNSTNIDAVPESLKNFQITQEPKKSKKKKKKKLSECDSENSGCLVTFSNYSPSGKKSKKRKIKHDFEFPLNTPDDTNICAKEDYSSEELDRLKAKDSVVSEVKQKKKKKKKSKHE